jgi:signal peptidase I
MKPRRRLVTSLGAAMVLVLTLAAWVAFAPTQLGGQASYVIVSGDSMEPGFHTGDFAIVRRASSYEVGDVVTYRHPDIGPVIHRIIGRDGQRYVFRGDHNAFVDGYQPADSELVGKLWIRVPGMGRWLELLKTPLSLALLTALALVGLAAPSGDDRAPFRRRHGRRGRPGFVGGRL